MVGQGPLKPLILVRFQVPQPMRSRTQQAILRRLTTRIRTGTLFIQLVYLDHHQKPDIAWIRNIYILLSFYTELLLKAIYVYEKKHGSKKELDTIFKKEHRHNLERIALDIGSGVLAKYGIYEVKRMRTAEYKIKSDVGTFRVKDFIDIRYDFIEGKIRKLRGDEHEMFKTQILLINRANAFLNGPAWA